MARALSIRLKTKDGQHLVNKLTLEDTVDDLKSSILEVTKIPSYALKVLQGFPPKLVDLTDGKRILSALNIRSGDTLIAEEDLARKSESASKMCGKDDVSVAIASQLNQSQGFLTRRVVPANNSCLFTSIHFVVEGGKLDLSCAPIMRKIIVQIVSSEPETYNAAFLGKSNADYCTWIMNDETWGGAIEISILSKFYQTEIDVVNTQCVRIDRFGEDQNYLRRVLLLYDGIHYDPLMLENADSTVPPKTVFPITDSVILAQALELAAEAKSSKQFTDIAKFSLRCLVCNKLLEGHVQAQNHASESGHINFGEV